MINFVKTGVDKNGFDNHFVDSVTKEISYKYDPDNENQYLVVHMVDGSTLHVQHKAIAREYAGSLYFEYNDDKFIIDDGYQDLLIKAGYVVLNNYNEVQIDNNMVGNSVFVKYYNYIYEILTKLFDDKKYGLEEFEVKKISTGTIAISFIQAGYIYNVYIDSISSIVSKNQQRKINSLPFYPFLKGMDKFGTMYISIFAKRIGEENKPEMVCNVDAFIKNLIDELNEYSDMDDSYHFELIPNRKMIHRYEGI